MFHCVLRQTHNDGEQRNKEAIKTTKCHRAEASLLLRCNPSSSTLLITKTETGLDNEMTKCVESGADFGKMREKKIKDAGREKCCEKRTIQGRGENGV